MIGETAVSLTALSASLSQGAAVLIFKALHGLKPMILRDHQ